MAQQLKKATVTILAGRKAGTAIEVLFNPAEYTHEISNKYEEIALPGLGNPILQFVNGETQTVTMELLFDTWTSGAGDVSLLTGRFAETLAIDAALHAPPPVEFRWGTFGFKAVVASISQRFTMFDAEGRPVRATLNVTFKQYRPLGEQLVEPRRNSADKTKRRIFESHDSLWAMAAREYGQPREWRRIARASRIANPRLIAAGTALILPPVEPERGRPRA